MAGGASNYAARAAISLRRGNHDGADVARRFRSGAPANRGPIGSIIALLGLDLAVPEHSTLSRRARTLSVPLRRRLGTSRLHLLIDSIGVKLGGAGEWLVEKHGTSRRRS